MVIVSKIIFLIIISSNDQLTSCSVLNKQCQLYGISTTCYGQSLALENFWWEFYSGEQALDVQKSQMEKRLKHSLKYTSFMML